MQRPEKNEGATHFSSVASREVDEQDGLVLEHVRQRDYLKSRSRGRDLQPQGLPNAGQEEPAILTNEKTRDGADGE